MCAGKDEAKSKIDRLIEAMDRLTDALVGSDRSLNPESCDSKITTDDSGLASI